jgi:hypothetical protein
VIAYIDANAREHSSKEVGRLLFRQGFQNENIAGISPNAAPCVRDAITGQHHSDSRHAAPIGLIQLLHHSEAERVLSIPVIGLELSRDERVSFVEDQKNIVGIPAFDEAINVTREPFSGRETRRIVKLLKIELAIHLFDDPVDNPGF